MAVILHTVLAASIGVYGALLLVMRHNLTAPPSRPVPSLKVVLLLVLAGAAQFGAVSWYGRAALRSTRFPPTDRVRRYFFLRGASAEAIAMYGLLAGWLRAPAACAAALFVMAAAALWSCAPTRAAWDEALRAAQSPNP